MAQILGSVKKVNIFNGIVLTHQEIVIFITESCLR